MKWKISKSDEMENFWKSVTGKRHRKKYYLRLSLREPKNDPVFNYDGTIDIRMSRTAAAGTPERRS